jgi:hypothetical protein
MGDDDWLYYATYLPPRQLYRTNIVTHDIEKYDTTGEQYFTCGAWYNGKYYYTPTRSWSLNEISFSGSDWTETPLYTGEPSLWPAGLFFGDIAITESGMLYGSAEYVSSSPKTYVFYSLDMNDITGGYTIIREYEQIPGGNDKWQLSLVGDTSQDGKWGLYGVSTAATRGVYQIDPNNGVETLLSVMPGDYPTDISINDGATTPYDASWADTNYALEDNWLNLPMRVQIALGRRSGYKPRGADVPEPDDPTIVRPRKPRKTYPVDPTTNPVTEALPGKLPERRKPRET